MPSKKEKILWMVKDPLERIIELTEYAYKHVQKCHPVEAILTETVKDSIKSPISIWRDIDENSKVWYYFNELKREDNQLLGIEKSYIMIVVKQVDKNFFIASWYAYGILSKKGAMEIWKRK